MNTPKAKETPRTDAVWNQNEHLPWPDSFKAMHDNAEALEIELAEVMELFPAICDAVGASCSPDSTVEFLKLIPGEVRLRISNLEDSLENLGKQNTSAQAYGNDLREKNASLKARVDRLERVLTEIASMWKPYHAEALVQWSDAGTEAFQDINWCSATAIKRPVELAKAALAETPDPKSEGGEQLVNRGNLVRDFMTLGLVDRLNITGELKLLTEDDSELSPEYRWPEAFKRAAERGKLGEFAKLVESKIAEKGPSK